MRKEDTMLRDFKDFYCILKVDFKKSRNSFSKMVKILRDFFLIFVSIWVIPLTHFVLFIFPFLRSNPEISKAERIKNLKQ